MKFLKFTKQSISAEPFLIIEPNITRNIIIETFSETLAIGQDSIALKTISHRAIAYLPNSKKTTQKPKK